MKCKAFLSIIDDYRLGRLADSERIDAESHLAICPRCSATLARDAALGDLLRTADIKIPDEAYFTEARKKAQARASQPPRARARIFLIPQRVAFRPIRAHWLEVAAVFAVIAVIGIMFARPLTMRERHRPRVQSSPVATKEIASTISNVRPASDNEDNAATPVNRDASPGTEDSGDWRITSRRAPMAQSQISADHSETIEPVPTQDSSVAAAAKAASHVDDTAEQTAKGVSLTAAPAAGAAKVLGPSSPTNSGTRFGKAEAKSDRELSQGTFGIVAGEAVVGRPAPAAPEGSMVASQASPEIRAEATAPPPIMLDNLKIAAGAQPARGTTGYRLRRDVAPRSLATGLAAYDLDGNLDFYQSSDGIRTTSTLALAAKPPETLRTAGAAAVSPLVFSYDLDSTSPKSRTTPEQVYLAAEDARLRGDYERAISLYEDAAREAGTSALAARAHLAIAEILDQYLKRPTDAASAYRKVLAPPLRDFLAAEVIAAAEKRLQDLTRP